ncbi:MAG: 16S rRNA (guanine(527)-N(7))-methyltransferase RsmG [Rhodoferax sp.]|nr:16S rRNA (guanine(527)-N(7))-methyltransferase RsmG [Rhodoferax sp.]
MRPLFEALQHGATALGLELTERQLGLLLDYLSLLQKWGQVYNLTAVRQPDEMLTHHLLDSLAMVLPLQARIDAMAPAPEIRLLDVGSGAGLPGVVIAVCCPDIHVSCVDTVAKKAAFIRQAALSLQLSNLQGIHARVENLPGEYDVVVSRAFASLADFTHLSANCLGPGGIWLAMKGKLPDVEMAALPVSVQVFHVEQIVVPGLNAERCLVWMKHNLS